MRGKGWREVLRSVGRSSAQRDADRPFVAGHGLHGWVDGYSEGRLRGWVLATARLDESLDLMCRAGGGAWRAARADHHRADVQRAYGSAGYHGFAIPVTALETSPAPAVFAVAPDGTEVRVPGGDAPVGPAISIRVGSRRLRVDPLYRSGRVSGWFIDDADPLRRCALRFEQEACEPATVRATRFRPDLVAGRGDALHGFSLDVAPVWPLHLWDADRGDELTRLR